MSNKSAARTTTYAVSEACQRLDVLMDQVTDCRDEPILIHQRGKEPVALVSARALADWLETAAYPAKEVDDEERSRLASILQDLETEYLLCSAENARRLLEASARAAAGEGVRLGVDQLRNRFGLADRDE